MDGETFDVSTTVTATYKERSSNTFIIPITNNQIPIHNHISAGIEITELSVSICMKIPYMQRRVILARDWSGSLGGTSGGAQTDALTCIIIPDNAAPIYKSIIVGSGQTTAVACFAQIQRSCTKKPEQRPGSHQNWFWVHPSVRPGGGHYSSGTLGTAPWMGRFAITIRFYPHDIW
ncbi:hypothetical protein CBL_05291 [Carabus blaptoides fortunei]